MTDVTTFDGTRLALYEWGPADAPIVVLVHGLGLSAESWGRVPELLADEHRVVAYDLRGHAQSGDARCGDYSMETQARDLDAVLREVVPEGRKAVVVGNSLGGGIIVAHAHHFGHERVAGAVFAGSGGSGVTFPGFPARDLPVPVQSALRLGWMKTLRAGAFLGRRLRPADAVVDHLVRRSAFTDDAPRELVTRVRNSFLDTRTVALSRTTLASVSHDGTRMAPDLDVPVLVVHGSSDPEVPADELQELISALPDVELVNLLGEGHMLPLTRPDTVAEQITRWVRHVGLRERGGTA